MDSLRLLPRGSFGCRKDLPCAVGDQQAPAAGQGIGKVAVSRR